MYYECSITAAYLVVLILTFIVHNIPAYVNLIVTCIIHTKTMASAVLMRLIAILERSLGHPCNALLSLISILLNQYDLLGSVGYELLLLLFL